MEITINDIIRQHEEANDPQGNEPSPTRCVECGRPIEPTFTAPALQEQGLCSWRCWGWLYGEEG